MLVILVGSLIAAKALGEFTVRVPDATVVLRSLGGGLGMGVGAAWAGGCTIGNSMVESSQFTYQGWLAFAFTLLGVGIGSRIFLPAGRKSAARRPVAVAVPA